MAKQTFYDQWHRIAELRVGLRPSVKLRKQVYGGEAFFVYNELIHAGFFRARPHTHELIQQISPNRNLHEIWRDFVSQSPKTAPGQKDFFDLIASLYRANLIYVEGGVSEEKLLERAIRKKKKPIANRISELLFFRIPLVDPEPWLKRAVPVINKIYSIPAVICVVLLGVWAGYEFILSADRAFAQSQTIMQMGNLIPLYIAMLVTHLAHEFSHAALCKYYGGQVRNMGVMLLMFTPLPYADVSSAWGMRNKWHRAAIGAAGMYADLVFCSIATILWAYSPPGILNEVTMNLMFVTAVYTVFFNANPLMRFDGYYILSDISGVPNLHQAAKKQIDTLFKTHILGDPPNAADTLTARRKSFLAGFFVFSNIYRIIIMVGIVKFVADQYFGLGLAVALALGYSTFIAPMIKFLKPLADPRFMAKHRKKISHTGWVAAALVGFIAFAPLPFSRVLEGVAEAQNKTKLFSPANGIVQQVHIKTGQEVAQGMVLVTLENPDLAYELQGIAAKITGVQARMAQSMAEGGQTFAAILQEYETMRETQKHLQEELQKLVIKAPHAGIFVAPELSRYKGQWVPRGTQLAVVSDPSEFAFRAILTQQGASEIAAIAADDTSVKLEGLRGQTIDTPNVSVIPFSQKDLPSAAVSPLAGGDVAMDLTNRDTPQAAERFFLIIAQLKAQGLTGQVLDGRRGWIRVELPARSIGRRAFDVTRQFFQERYKL